MDQQRERERGGEREREREETNQPCTSSTPKKSELPADPTAYMTSASCSLVVIWNWTEVVDDDDPPDRRQTSDSSTTELSSVKTTGSIVVESAQSENVGAPCVSTSA